MKENEKIYFVSIIVVSILISIVGIFIIYENYFSNTNKNDDEIENIKISTQERKEIENYIHVILSTDIMCSHETIPNFTDINNTNKKWISEVAFRNVYINKELEDVTINGVTSQARIISLSEINDQAKLLFGDNFIEFKKEKAEQSLEVLEYEYYFKCGTINNSEVYTCYHPGHGGDGNLINLITDMKKINNRYTVTIYTRGSYHIVTTATEYYGIPEGTEKESSIDECKSSIGKKFEKISDLKCKGIYRYLNDIENKKRVMYQGEQSDFENYIITHENEFDKMELTIIRNHEGKLNITSSIKVN